jgi:site-specific recombinase XerD
MLPPVATSSHGGSDLHTVQELLGHADLACREVRDLILYRSLNGRFAVAIER